MSTDRRNDNSLELRLEVLRLRGALQRTQAAEALARTRAGLMPLSRLAKASSGAAAWLGPWAGRLPWVAPLALRALATLRRHPRVMLAVGAGALLATVLSRRSPRSAGLARSARGPAGTETG